MYRIECISPREKGGYEFSADLRTDFPEEESNHDIRRILEDNNILPEETIEDCEYSQAFFYFPDFFLASIFLHRLNDFIESREKKDPYKGLTFSTN